MNIKQIEECLKSIYEDEFNKSESMKMLYKDNILYVSYFMQKILKEENDISEFINRVFDRTFKHCEEHNVSIDEYSYKLKESAILVCDSVLKSKVGEYNDKIGIKEKDYMIPNLVEDGMDDASLFSNEIRNAVINSIDNLNIMEKLIAYEYYYFEFNYTTISSILDISYDMIVNIHKRIKYCIEETLQNYYHTSEIVPYTKNVIRIYFYNDQNNLSKELLEVYNTDDYYFEKYGFLKKKTIPETSEEVLPNKNNEKKRKITLVVILLVSIVAVLIAISVIGIIIYKNHNQIIETTSLVSQEITNEIINDKIDMIDEEIILCNGDEYPISFRTSPSNSMLSALIGIKEYNEQEKQDIYYQISSDDVVSYDPYNMKIKAKSSGDTVFTIGTYINGQKVTSSIVIHVYDSIDKFSFEEDIIGVIYGEEQELVLNTIPYIDYRNIKWVSENEDIALAYNGKVIGLAIGETKVSAEIKGFVNDKLTTIKAETVVKVVNKLDTNVKVRGSFETKINDMYIGQSYRLNYTCTPNEDYVYLKIVTYDDSDIEYNPQTKIITPLQPGPILIYLYNGLNTSEHLDSFMVTIHDQNENSDTNFN